MAIHTEDIEEVQGFTKEIDAGAISLILDNLQQYQYQHPQKSAIRELVSNGLDAIREKQIALSILSGKTKVEDHYIHREDAVNGDSNFDPNYYNRGWLFDDKSPHGAEKYHRVPNASADTVYITYEESALDKDKVIIEDFGVGMGAKRLEGYFKIGFSTKRNTKEALGKFGIGAKAGLSTAPYYTVTSRYNGREYVFNVYPHNVQSVVPKMELWEGKMVSNGVHIFSNGATIHYRETKLPNGVRVELESKKHHKQLFVEAVKSQLLYFDNVEFRVRNQQGQLSVIPIKANILYEDENILLSDNTQYSRPHVLISRVNYGPVDWQELELSDVRGNIALKVPAEEVTVNPSRENLIWNEQTRKTIVGFFGKIKTAAEEMVARELKVDDFVEWLVACSQIGSRYGVDSVIGRLSSLVDMSGAKIPYVKEPSIIYGIFLFEGIEIRANTLSKIREGSTVKYKINRSEYGISSAFAEGKTIFLQQKGTSFKTDKYLLSVAHPEGFITIKDPFAQIQPDGSVQRDVSFAKEEAVVELAKSLLKSWAEKEKKKATVKDEITFLEIAKKQMWNVMHWLLQSKHLKQYEDVVIPEDFDSKEEVEDEKTAEQEKAKKERELLRRGKGEIPIFTPRVVTSSYITPTARKNNEPFRMYEWQKINIPVADIDKWDEEEVFYANEEDSGLLHLAAMVTRPNDSLSWNTYSLWEEGRGKDRNDSQSVLYNKLSADHQAEYARMVSFSEWGRCNNFFPTTGRKPAVKLIKVAQDRVKFFLDFKPIQRFFMDIKNKTLTMSNALVRWNTARLIFRELPKLRFLQGFDRFSPKYHAWYREIRDYAYSYYRDLKEHSKDDKYYSLKEKSYDDLVEHMDKITQLQLFVRDNPSEGDKIAELVKDMFNPQAEINNGLAVDLSKIDKLKELLDFSQSISTLLNEVKPLIEVTGAITGDLETEIRAYCAMKGITL